MLILMFTPIFCPDVESPIFIWMPAAPLAGVAVFVMLTLPPIFCPFTFTLIPTLPFEELEGVGAGVTWLFVGVGVGVA